MRFSKSSFEPGRGREQDEATEDCADHEDNDQNGDGIEMHKELN
jgi:hypothetical protein